MITEILLRSKKINIFLVFITKFYFAVQKSMRLISTYDFTLKAANKQKLRQIVINDSSNTEFKDFMKLYQKKFTAKPFFFIVTWYDINREVARKSPLSSDKIDI